jgi:hypothetical protein
MWMTEFSFARILWACVTRAFFNSVPANLKKMYIQYVVEFWTGKQETNPALEVQPSGVFSNKLWVPSSLHHLIFWFEEEGGGGAASGLFTPHPLTSWPSRTPP